MKIFVLSLSRMQRFGERTNLQFRAEFFNAFNTPQSDGPTGSVTSVNFGKITSASGARNIQLALRLTCPWGRASPAHEGNIGCYVPRRTGSECPKSVRADLPQHALHLHHRLGDVAQVGT